MVNEQSPAKPTDKGKAPAPGNFQAFTPAAAVGMSSVKSKYRQVPTPRESVRADSEATQEEPAQLPVNFPSTIREDDGSEGPDAASSPRQDSREEHVSHVASQIYDETQQRQAQFDTAAGPSGQRRSTRFDRPPRPSVSYLRQRIPQSRSFQRAPEDDVFETPPQLSAPPIEARRDFTFVPAGNARRASLFDAIPRAL